MTLTIQRGTIQAPLRILLLGQEGVGKTSFAAAAPSPVFIDCEEGSGFLDVPRVQFGGGLVPTGFAQLREALLSLYNDPHEFATVVIDTADALDGIIHEDLCRRHGWPSIDGEKVPGYGKGYLAAMEEWRRVMHALDALRVHRNMGVIVLAHTTISNFANPSGKDYSRFSPAMHKRSAELLRGWADVVLFAHFEDAELKGEKKAVSTGKRVIRTQRDAAWDAKNRLGLPPVLPLDWSSFAQAGRLNGILANVTPVSGENA